MWFKEHCRRCKEELGDEFQEVNRWLDELAHVPTRHMEPWEIDEIYQQGRGPLNPYHRKTRHNVKGIEYVLSQWGPDAAEAAVLHIMDDLHLTKREDIPLDEKDYIRKGFC